MQPHDVLVQSFCHANAYSPILSYRYVVLLSPGRRDITRRIFRLRVRRLIEMTVARYPGLIKMPHSPP